MDYASIKEESKRAVLEVIEKARLKEGDILVVGCSSSEIRGDSIGKNSDIDCAKAAFEGIYPELKDKDIIGVNLEKLFLTFRYPQNRKYFVICKRILFPGKVQSFLINTARFGGFFCLCFFRVCNKGIIRQAAAVKRLFLFAFLWEIFYFRDCLNCKCLKKPAAFYIAQCRPQICGVKPAFAEEKFCPV